MDRWEIEQGFAESSFNSGHTTYHESFNVSCFNANDIKVLGDDCGLQARQLSEKLSIL